MNQSSVKTKFKQLSNFVLFMGSGLSFPYAVLSSLDRGSGFMDPGEKGLCIAE